MNGDKVVAVWQTSCQRLGDATSAVTAARTALYAAPDPILGGKRRRR